MEGWKGGGVRVEGWRGGGVSGGLERWRGEVEGWRGEEVSGWRGGRVKYELRS